MSEQELISKNELDDWRSRIEAAWQKSVESVIEVGRLVQQAKSELGASYSVLETELPFSSTVAAFLIKIVENPILSDPQYFNRLPNSYNTLYHLSSIDNDELVKQIEDGVITPDYGLTSAKKLKSQSSSTSDETNNKETKSLYEVGKIQIEKIEDLEGLKNDLNKLLKKYNGSISYSKNKESLYEHYHNQLLQQSLQKIEELEKSLNDVSLDQLRMLEDAADFLSKDTKSTVKKEVEDKGKKEMRSCLPDDYEHLKDLQNLIGKKDIFKNEIRQWCIENKIPNKFTELRSIDKELYVWEQVRLVLEKKDVKGGMKRLKDMGQTSSNPNIRELSNTVLHEINLFK
jgi:superfamily II RNA helicase